MRSRSEQITRFVGKRFAIIYSIGDNAQRQGYGMGSCFGLGVPIGENAGERWDFGDPTPIVFALEFNLEHSDPWSLSPHCARPTKRRMHRFPADGNDRRFLFLRTPLSRLRQVTRKAELSIDLPEARPCGKA